MVTLKVRGVRGSSLCPTRTRPNRLRWGRFQPAIDLDAISDQAGQVVLDFGFSSISLGSSDFSGFG